MKLGDVLRRERQARRLTTAQMDEMLSISEREYLQIEGGAVPKTDLTRQLGKLGIRYQELDDYP